MKNVLNFFYNLNPENIYQTNKEYRFHLNSDTYYFIPYNRELSELKEIYDLNKLIIKNDNLANEIILNKDKNIITLINDNYYMLMKVYVNPNSLINLADISNISKILVPFYNKQLVRYNWWELWSTKIDYYEVQISEIGQKYSILCDTLHYYIGLAENAISYLKNMEYRGLTSKQEPLSISHKRIKNKMTLFDLYNPLNSVVDYKSRDLAEYIKTSYFNNKDIWPELHEYFNNNRLTIYEYNLLFARLLYPSYYFDVYDEIINEGKDQHELLNIVEKAPEYEDFLLDIYYYLSKYVNIEAIDWLIRKQ